MLRRDVLTNGIDVSQYQGLINWEVVKNLPLFDADMVRI